MIKSRIRGLIIASAISVVALSAGTAATFALFSRQVNNTVHVKIGNIKFKYERINFISHSLDDRGIIVEKPADTTVIDYSNNGLEAFSAEDAAPGTDYEATFRLTNLGRTSFTVTVEMMNPVFTCLGADASSEQKNEFFNHSTVNINNGTPNMRFNDKDTSYTFVNPLRSEGVLVFPIKIAIDDKANNLIQNMRIDFDLRLICTQYIG